MMRSRQWLDERPAERPSDRGQKAGGRARSLLAEMARAAYHSPVAADRSVDDTRGSAGSVAVEAVADRSVDKGRSRSRPLAFAAVAVVSYTCLSIFCWHYLIGAGITSHMYRLNLGDVGQGVWFMGWLPFSLSHHVDPFVSRYMFAPQGVNLLTNTNFFLQAFLLAPVTELSSPLTAFNVACIAAPVVSSTSMCYVARRLRMGRGVAFIGGLVYGFTPAILQADAIGHFNLTWMFFPPLLILLLERILCRQEGSALRYGLLLGGLVVVQYFNSPEILLDCTLLSVPAVAALAVANRAAVKSHARFALVGLGTAVGIAVVLLAYPLWVYVAGPDHVAYVNASVAPGAALSSPVWPSAATGHGFLVAPPGESMWRRFDVGFIGPVVVALALGSLCFVRRQRVIGLLFGLSVVSFVLSWGSRLRTTGNTGVSGWHAPAYFLAKAVPLLRNVGWIRISVITDGLVVLLAMVTLQQLSAMVRRRFASRWREVVLTVAGTLAAGAMVVPLLVAGEVPFGSVESVRAPAVLDHIPETATGKAPIALVFPAGSLFDGTPLAWQALSGFSWRDWGGYAWHPLPGGHGLGRAVPDRSLALYLTVNADATPPRIVLTPAQHHQITLGLSAMQISYVVVVNGYPGSAQLTRVFSQLYGSGQRYPSGTIWHSGTISRSAAPAIAAVAGS
jgi:hypothetical protein